MQSYALTVDKFLDHAAKWSGNREVVTADFARTNYAALRGRSNRMSGAFGALGMRFGDRIGTLAWNTQHHMEVYYAAMGAGMVCHTLNPRLTIAHLSAMINEAQDKVLAISADLWACAKDLIPLLPGLQHVILLDGAIENLALKAAPVRVWDYEHLLDLNGAPVPWGEFHEETPAGLCYTSGTTGNPKGVLYTHRSNYLHTLRSLQADATGLTGSDSVLVAVPMFHANGWGFPFAAPAVGAKLVLPGRHADGASLAKLMQKESVTVAAGVQTVWLSVVEHLDAVGGDLPDLKRVIIGGSSCPDALIRRFEDRLGCRVQTSWGMSELSPQGVIASPNEPASDTRSSGRPVLGIDLKLTDADGAMLPEQRGVVGRLKVKGASVIDRYFKAEKDALDEEGYFDTGDLARIDEAGNLSICGRSKDLIKSGGEWINPAEIEEIIGRHPAVAQVAVIGRADTKWGERPVLIVSLHKGNAVDDQTLLKALRGRVADWWLPDQILQIAKMPLAATGKIDKNQLSADYMTGELTSETSGV
jgi:acyl-CoA synthetase (AMP-forming)/AMP-acid ligase II